MIKKPRGGVLVNLGIAVLFCAVIALTAAIITLLNTSAAFGAEVPFRLEQLTSSHTTVPIDTDSYLSPSFIGIRAGGEQKGISAGINIVGELYDMLTPVLYDVFSVLPMAVSEEHWTAAARESSFVYVKYHSPLPYEVLHAFVGGQKKNYTPGISVYELFVLPDKGFRTLVRTAEGAVYEFGGTYEAYFTGDSLTDMIESYSRSFVDFVFSEDGAGEPLFRDRVLTRNMLVTNKTAALIQNRDSDIAALLRLMGYNPDKLYTHEESDIGFVYVENHGVMRLLDESIEYTAVNGGIDISRLIGSYDTHGLRDYIRAACYLMNRLRGMSSHYMGGDGDIVLTRAWSDEEGILRLRFVYTFDNLILAQCEPAFEIGFLDGAIQSMRLYTVSMRNLGEQEESLLEWWYYDMAKARCPEDSFLADVHLVYRTNFLSESITAEWSAVYGAQMSEATPSTGAVE